ncbi:zinc metalloprotease HtpX [Desulfatiferula olefinivorans]
MNQTRLTQSRLAHELKTVLMIALMAVLLGLLAYIVAGAVIAVLVLALIAGAYAVGPSMAPRLAMRFFKARSLSYLDAPGLHQMLRSLSSRAGLENLPELYLIPSPTPAAFAVGDSDKSAVALSAGLLNRLEPVEIAGVTAHEISHIRNNDMRAMWFAMLISRVTDLLSMAGQVLLIITLPMVLISQVTVSWLPIALLIMAPSLSYLVQLGLSRVHEFKADLGSAEIMGSPEPLISALAKIEYGRPGFLGYWFPMKRPETESVLFRTHPPTAERIRRLKEIRPHYPMLARDSRRTMHRRVPVIGNSRRPMGLT